MLAGLLADAHFLDHTAGFANNRLFRHRVQLEGCAGAGLEVGFGCGAVDGVALDVDMLFAQHDLSLDGHLDHMREHPHAAVVHFALADDELLFDDRDHGVAGGLRPLGRVALLRRAAVEVARALLLQEARGFGGLLIGNRDGNNGTACGHAAGVLLMRGFIAGGEIAEVPADLFADGPGGRWAACRRGGLAGSLAAILGDHVNVLLLVSLAHQSLLGLLCLAHRAEKSYHCFRHL